MRTSDFSVFAEYYDKLYLKRGKDYEKEVEVLEGIIKQMESRKSKTMLDVGCGTGNHLKHFSKNFLCTGIDINRRMIEIARRKVPVAGFKVANMINLKLKDRFDVITCLFSSIGYVQSFGNLVKTLENFHKHLNEKGIAIVEPWVFKKDFKAGTLSLDTVEDEEVKFVRMATSKMGESEWLVFMHYLVGQKGKIRYVKELHKMALLDREDYLKAFKLAQFKNVKYLKDDLWRECRGLFVATK
jgi:ubiquinone/menaquinone biosynthesis C-methylase UbiE